MKKSRPGHSRPPGHGELLDLARRKYQLALLISVGCTNQEAATTMGLTISTVRVMSAAIYNQLGLTVGGGNLRVRLAALVAETIDAQEIDFTFIRGLRKEDEQNVGTD